MNKKPGMTLARGRILYGIEKDIRFEWKSPLAGIPFILTGFRYDGIMEGMI